MAMSTKAGKALNSSASSMKSAVRKTPTARATENESSTSRSGASTGRTIIRTIPMMPSGTTMSQQSEVRAGACALMAGRYARAGPTA